MGIRQHPNYTDDDYAYMTGRGYTDDQIADHWTREAHRKSFRAEANAAAKHDPERNSRVYIDHDSEE